MTALYISITIFLAVFWMQCFILYDEFFWLIHLFLNRHILAFHEAGHSVVVWTNSMVSAFDYATIDYSVRGGWTCWTEHQWDKTTDLDWCRLVIALGGMAGEYRFLDQVRTSWSSADLKKAWEVVQRIAITNDPPPWESNEQTDFPFQQIYPTATPEHIRILGVAWNKALEVIDQYGERFQRLVRLILKKTTVKEADVEPILGSRSLVCACAAASVFVHPKRLKGDGDVRI